MRSRRAKFLEWRETLSLTGKQRERAVCFWWSALDGVECKQTNFKCGKCVWIGKLQIQFCFPDLRYYILIFKYVVIVISVFILVFCVWKCLGKYWFNVTVPIFPGNSLDSFEWVKLVTQCFSFFCVFPGSCNSCCIFKPPFEEAQTISWDLICSVGMNQRCSTIGAIWIMGNLSTHQETPNIVKQGIATPDSNVSHICFTFSRKSFIFHTCLCLLSPQISNHQTFEQSLSNLFLNSLSSFRLSNGGSVRSHRRTNYAQAKTVWPLPNHEVPFFPEFPNRCGTNEHSFNVAQINLSEIFDHFLIQMFLQLGDICCFIRCLW